MKKKTDSKIRTTTGGTKVVIKETIGKNTYLVEAISRNGNFVCQVAEKDLV